MISFVIEDGGVDNLAVVRGGMFRVVNYCVLYRLECFFDGIF